MYLYTNRSKNGYKLKRHMKGAHSKKDGAHTKKEGANTKKQGANTQIFVKHVLILRTTISHISHGITYKLHL